ncbi:MAG: glycerophosphodiester phosphodiesterase [Ilumatobacteraceae bacterium]
MQQRLPSLLDKPITFAHRGARAHAPENTIEAFALALRLGSSGLESDVWLTADGHPVLDHDGIIRRRLGRSARIADLLRHELPPHIPTLDDLLAECGSGYHLSLDIKHPRAGQRVVAVVPSAAPGLLDRLWLCSPERDVLRPLRGSGARLVDSTRLARIKEGPERRAAALAADGIDAINLHHTDWNGGLVALFHRFDRIAFGWDLQAPHLLEDALRMGLDGVFSDYPDRMADAFRAQIGAL